jgi:hypothetical protein
MAKATVDTAVEVVKTEVREEVIQLTLSKLEARALMALAGLPYGSIDTYNREINAIRRVVQAAGRFGYIAPSNYFRIDDEGDIAALEHKAADK